MDFGEGFALVFDKVYTVKKVASILGVNDDPSLLKAWGRIGEYSGIRKITLSASTVEAETELRKQSFDLILCRYRMSPENGIAFMTRMRSQGIQTPVIFISSSPDTKGVLESTQVGYAEFLPAPFALEEFSRRIEFLFPVS